MDTTEATSTTRQEVVVKNIQMSFGAMVVFMVKWSIASIPALVILTVLMTALYALLGGVFLGIMSSLF